MIISAIVYGHTTSLQFIYGFGVITVLHDLPTRTPLRFALKKPSLPSEKLSNETILSVF